MGSSTAYFLIGGIDIADLKPKVSICPILHSFFLLKLVFALNHLRSLQVVEWGADGVIVGSAIVKILGEAASPKEGLAALEKFTNDLKNALP